MMNRIILIGNGFDLAHGLKTSYADFINWYWKEWGKRLLHGHDRVEDDGLCSFALNDCVGLANWAYVWGWHYQRPNPIMPWDEYEVVSIAQQDKDLCRFTIKDEFFKEICTSVETKGWVDIENVYYSYLSHQSTYLIDVSITNKDLEIIRICLINYLSEIQKGINDSMVKDVLRRKMTQSFVERDMSVEGLHHFDLKTKFVQSKTHKTPFVPDKILMLNFNYTTLADQYLNKNNNYIVNHIHGELSDPNSVIFGYGDELDANYKVLSEKNDNAYLRNIKSIKYLESPNYRNLLEFIESSPYQIYIMGHSCGNSDRTLLNTLFEHRNCVSIKPFYYVKQDGTDNYIELAQNISRNFTDMKMMRDRVVNKTYCETM